MRQTSSWDVFQQVGSLLQQMVESEAFILTDAQVWKTLEPQVKSPSQTERFVVVASPDFSALLTGTQIKTNSTLCQLDLTFEPDAIAAFLTRLESVFPASKLNYFKSMLQPNRVERQNQFTLKLIEILSTTAIASTQQIEQERLLNEVTALIRQTLELPVILETAVEQVRQFLQVDRLIIYQFKVPAPSCLLDPSLDESLGAAIPNLDGITYESRSSDSIPSVLHWMESDSNVTLRHFEQRHRDGLTWATSAPHNLDKNQSNSTIAALLKLAQDAPIRAELATSIVVQNQLWGLLIAHQCWQPRQWQEREKTLLRRIAEHLEIAIYQAKIYAELQQQKDTLEQQIVDRTAELRDTMIAAQAANRAKSEFLATMSHELRSPLTTIIGMSTTLLRYHTQQQGVTQTLTRQKQNEYLQTIHDRGEQLLTLINDILDLANVESGKLVLQVRSFSLLQVADHTINSLQEKADAKQVELCLEPNPIDDDLQFQADPDRVGQILTNLMSNAIKFTPSGGRVTLRICVNATSAMLQVEDTGIGIAAEHRSLLFQKFQQLDGSYHRRYEGTGLGLALTKQLVELHGGSIDVESIVGVGSKFTVFLTAQA